MGDELRREDGGSGRSRREVLAGAAGALGVLVAQAATHLPAAHAMDGQPVILGQTNTAATVTTIDNDQGFGDNGLEVSGSGFLGKPGGGNGVVGTGGPSGQGGVGG